MRITSTTSVPVRAKEITAAGPAEAMTTPLPTNRPAPITPPRAIMCMWRRCSARRSPLESESGAVCGRGAQCRRDVGEPLDADTFAAERARHGGPAGVLQIDPLVAPRVEVDVILLFRAPLCIVEDDHRP